MIENFCGIYKVMTKNRTVNFNMRIREDIRENFKIAVHVKGSTASNVVHQYMADYAYKIQANDPAKFEMHRQLLKEERAEAPELDAGVGVLPKSRKKITVKLERTSEPKSVKKTG